MNCQRCQSERVAHISCKHDDRFSLSCPADGVEVEADYAPKVENICGRDDTRFSVCLECGQVQGKFPVTIEVR
jgi:hypothetical protein